MLATGPRPSAWPGVGNWAEPTATGDASGSVATPAAATGSESANKPAGTFAASDQTPDRSGPPLQPREGPLQLAFMPPAERAVGVPVVGELTIASQAECEATVLVEGRRGLRIANAPEGVLYQGPLRLGQTLKLPVRLVAGKPGSQRLRIRLVPSVPLASADLDILVPGFTGEALRPGEAIVNLRFRNAPLDRAIRRMAAEVGARVVIHDDVERELVTYDFSAGVPLVAALRILCDAAGCRVEERDGVYHILK